MTGRGRAGLNCLRLASRARLTTADPGGKFTSFNPLRNLGVPKPTGAPFCLCYCHLMATTFLYCCPATGQTVQGGSAEEVTDDDTAYESVECLACAQVHLINPKTGKVLGVTEH